MASPGLTLCMWVSKCWHVANPDSAGPVQRAGLTLGMWGSRYQHMADPETVGASAKSGRMWGADARPQKKFAACAGFACIPALADDAAAMAAATAAAKAQHSLPGIPPLTLHCLPLPALALFPTHMPAFAKLCDKNKLAILGIAAISWESLDQVLKE